MRGRVWSFAQILTNDRKTIDENVFDAYNSLNIQEVGAMTVRENFHAVMQYEDYEALPVVGFGFWTQTLRKWRDEGHLKPESVLDRPMYDFEYDDVTTALGFDFNWNSVVGMDQYLLDPLFEPEVVQQLEDGKQLQRDIEGNLVVVRPGEASIPQDAGHTLVDRQSWEKHYLPRLNYGAEKIDQARLTAYFGRCKMLDIPAGLFCGSLVGRLRNWLGLEEFVYLWVDDPEFFTEMVDTLGGLMFRQTEAFLSRGTFDYALFWEDICGNDGPLVLPGVLDEVAGPHYERITGLLRQHGVNVVSLDCDGKIDALVPIWLRHGVNTMFPIEIGNWNASIAPWRAQHGRELRGVGGVDKRIFGMDRAAIDAEIERLKPLVELGGYLPCPDHRIPPDAIWENVQYYCDAFRRAFS